MGKLERVFFMSISLPPLDKYCHFHMANLLLCLSSILSQTALELCFAPKRRLKYSIGKDPIL